MVGVGSGFAGVGEIQSCVTPPPPIGVKRWLACAPAAAACPGNDIISITGSNEEQRPRSRFDLLLAFAALFAFPL